MIRKCMIVAAILGLLVVGVVGMLVWRVKPKATDTVASMTPFQLRDVTSATGIDFVHTDGSSGRRYIIEPMCSGLAIFDYNGDGLLDIYFLNGAALRGKAYDRPPTNMLYRNEGNWTFTNVTEESGAGDTGYGLGVAVGDFDNDGDADFYVNNYGPNALYRNQGDGTFEKVPLPASAMDEDFVGAGASFLDIDADGNLDLYAANYLAFDYAKHVERLTDGIPTYPTPRDYSPIPDNLYRNNGDGTFQNISMSSGIGKYAGAGMGTICADCDGDGDTDIFVVNDVAENYYFENDGHGHFKENAVFNGVAYNYLGDENASMGVDCGDYDNDGLLDFFMTSYQGEMPVLYRNTGGGSFQDVTIATKSGLSTISEVNWGTAFVDFDNDGDRDVFIANGHTEDNIDLRDSGSTYRAQNTLLENTGENLFLDVSNRSGSGLLPVRSSRGVAFDDLDNDGDIDGVILNTREEPTIIENEVDSSAHWFEIRLRGVNSNRDAVGTRVQITAGGRTQIAEVHSGRSYQSHFGTRLHFGLGQHDRIDRIEIHWHGSAVEVIENVRADQIAIIVEGQGKVLSLPQP